MNCRTIYTHWLVLYLILATPGSQIVLCWGEDSHLALETLSGEFDHCHPSASSSPPSVNFSSWHTQREVPTCIDFPLSLALHSESIPPSIPSLNMLLFHILSLTVIGFVRFHRLSQFLPERRWRIQYPDIHPSSVSLQNVCLLI